LYPRPALATSTLCDRSGLRALPKLGFKFEFDRELVLAWSHAVLSLSYLVVLVTALHGARRLLMRRKVRRGLDATTGVVLLGFSARLATAHV
jgi:arginine exporter protein ArgO